MKLVYLTSALASANIVDYIATKQGSEFASALANHGCHCKKLAEVYDKDNVGGAPIDALDALCRDYFSAKSCTKLIGGKCQDADVENLSTTTPYGGNLFNYWNGLGFTVCPETLYGENTCGDELCQNSKNFVDQVSAYGSDVSALNPQALCTSVQTAPKSHCCGSFPSLIKYSEDEGVCVNGEFTEIEGPSFNWEALSMSNTLDLGANRLYFGMVSDNDNIYVAGRANDLTPTIWAYGKSDNQLKDTYTYGTGQLVDFYDVAVTDHFVIATMQHYFNGRIVVFDKQTGAITADEGHQSPGMLRADNNNVLVARYYDGNEAYLKLQDDGSLLLDSVDSVFETLYRNRGGVALTESHIYYGCRPVGTKHAYGYPIYVWDRSTKVQTAEMTGHKGTIYDIKVYGDYVISASADDTVRIWNPTDGTEVGKVELDHYVYRVAIAGDYLIVNSWKTNHVKLYVYDLNKVINENDTTLVKLIELADTHSCYALNYFQDIHQFHVGCTNGKVHVFSF